MGGPPYIPHPGPRRDFDRIMTSFKALTRLSAASLLLVLAACSGDDGGDDTTITPSVKIDAFSASPTTVANGGTTTLSWQTTNATNVEIIANPGGEVLNTADASGTVTSNAITQDTTFILTAQGPGGPVTATVMVTLMGANNPMVSSFTAMPATIAPGGSATLAWTTVNADSVTITAGGTTVVDAGPANGNQAVMPADTTEYTLVATGAGGTAMATVTVTVSLDPIINSFTGMPSPIDPGDTVTFNWDVTNADTIVVTDDQNVEIYNGADAMGTATAMPNVTTTYTLVATNANGSANQTVMITVNPVQGPNIVSFDADQTVIDLGMPVTLSWEVTNATSVNIDDGAGTATTTTDLTGSWVVYPAANATFTLTADDGNTQVTAQVMITVNAAAPGIVDFTATPNPAALNGTTTLSFQVVGADTVRIARGATDIYNGTVQTDTITTAPLTETSTTFTLWATNMTGTNMATITVDAQNAPSIDTFTVAPGTFVGTTTATLTYAVSSVQRLELFVDGTLDTMFPGPTGTTAVDAMGTYSLSISQSTEFRLVATSAGGTAEATVRASTVVVETEPNNDAGTAIAFPNGSVVQGDINPGDDEDWYSIVVQAGYSVRAETTDGMGGCPFDTNLTLTSTDGTTQLVFDDDDGIGLCSLIDPARDPAAANLPAGTYYVSVGSFQANTGTYVLDIQVNPPACGNGIIDGTDLCDDGNTTNGDGCDSMCQLEIANTYTAPGAPQTFTATVAGGTIQTIQITANAETYIRAETFSNAMSASCRIDSIVVLLDSNGTAIAGDDFDGVNSCSQIDPVRDNTRVPAGTYYLVYAADNANDMYVELVVEGVAVDICGNGIVDGTMETCDDGNTMPGDGCDATCQVEAAGAFTATGGNTQTFAGQTLAVGQLDTYLVTVPAGNDVYLTAETFENAMTMTCPNIDTVLRLLDNGNTRLGTDDEGGVGSCSRIDPAIDGFARLTGGATYFVTVEEFQLNAAITYDLVLSAVTADVCGNGVIETGEVCDDGNTANNDGCDSMCQPEVRGTFNAVGGQTQTFTGGPIAVNNTETWAITVPMGGDVYVDAETFTNAAMMACTNIDTVIRLFDSNATEIASDDQGGVGDCSRIDFALGDTAARLSPGNYTLTVEDWLLNTPIPAYEIVFSATAADICGNGFVEMGEDCDDGNTMGGDACPANCVFANSLTGNATPAVAIPDNNAAGITDTITLPAMPNCTISNVSVDIGITHTYRGDLIVELTSPAMTTVRLWNRTGGSANDLVGNFPATLAPANPLTPFNGAAGNGAWTISVSDNAGLDTGTLDSWGLTVGCQ